MFFKRFELKKNNGFFNKALSFVMLLCVFFSAAVISPKPVVQSEGVYGICYVYSDDGELNVRSGPGTSCEVTDILYNDEQVSVTGYVPASDGSTWCGITYFHGTKLKRGYVHSAYLKQVAAEDDPEFEKILDAQGFPERYKTYLRVLHKVHPSWEFNAFMTNLEWQVVFDAEAEYGESSIEKSVISSWKSTKDGAYDWTTSQWANMGGSGWTQASDEIIAFYLDPRNFLNDQQIFQFEQVSFNEKCHTETAVEAVLSGTFMSHTLLDPTSTDTVGGVKASTLTYAKALIMVGKELNVSPCMLASRVRQEQGTEGTNKLISGTVAGYEGYYNYYNIGATGDNASDVLANGLAEAKKEGWNSRYKALIGGARKVVTGHIQRGQDTLYLQKFDVDPTYDGLFWHQYMQNIRAASHESVTVRNSYASCGALDNSFVFKIPVYKNMPQYPCEQPSESRDPNNRLSSLSVDGYKISPTFAYNTYSYSIMVPSNVGQIKINASAYSPLAEIEGTGVKTISSGTNSFSVRCFAENETFTEYTVKIVKTSPTSTPTSTPTATSTHTASPVKTSTAAPTSASKTTAAPTPKPVTSVSIDKSLVVKSKFISGITPGTTVGTILGKIAVSNGRVSALKEDGTKIDSKTKSATGQIIRVYDSSDKVYAEYLIVIYGDLNGDGAIDPLDFVYMKRFMWGISAFTGAYKEAADVSPDKGTVDALDFVYMKRQVWGISDIVQK